jgi:hypothetical protein
VRRFQSSIALGNANASMPSQLADMTTGYSALVAPVHQIAIVLNPPVINAVKNSAMLAADRPTVMDRT